MPTVGNLEINVIANAAEFQAVMGQVQTKLVQVGATTQTTLGGQTVAAATQGTVAIQKLGESMDKAGTVTAGLGGRLFELGKVFEGTGAIAGVVSAVGFLGSKYAEIQQLTIRLQTAVENTGASFGAYKGKIDAAATAGNALGFTTVEQAQALSVLVAQTSNVNDAMTRLRLAMDLSRATGLDLTTTSLLLGKVTDDNTRVLQRYGITIKAGATEAEFFAAVQAKVGGQAAAQADTLASSATKIETAWTDTLANIGGFANQIAPGFTALAVAFNSLGLKAVFASFFLGRMTEELGKTLTALKAFGGVLVGLLVPLALVAAGVAVAVGAMKLLSNIPGLKFLGDELDQIAAIVSKIGVGGLLGGIVEQTTGFGKAAADVNSLATATDVWGKALAGVSTQLAALGGTGTSAFTEVHKQLTAFLGDMPHASEAIQEIEDKLNGVFGLGSQGRFEKIGADLLASTKAAGDAITAPLQALYDSASNELAAVARFWADEAQRRMDFTQMMADRAKPVVDTIDQLNKDLGAGFDQRRRAAQAVVKQAQFDAETAKLQQTENRRIANLNPPSTANVDKVNELYGSMAALNLLISQKHADTAASLAATTALITAREADLAEAARIARQEALFATTIPESALAAAAGRGGSLAGPMSDADLSNNRVFGGMPYRIGQSIIDAVTKGIGTMFSATQFQLDLTNSDGSLTGMRPDDVKALFSLIVQGAQTKLNAGQITASGDAVVA